MSLPASWSVIFAVALGCQYFSWLCAIVLDAVDLQKRTASYAAWRAAVTKKG